MQNTKMFGGGGGGHTNAILSRLLELANILQVELVDSYVASHMGPKLNLWYHTFGG